MNNVVETDFYRLNHKNELFYQYLQIKIIMNIAVISNYSFPNGMAASNRIIAYSKGLVANGDSVHLICVRPTDKYILNDKLPTSGCFNGINYTYVTGRYKNKYKVFRAISLLSGFRFIYGAFKTMNFLDKNHFDAILFSDDAPKAQWLYTKIGKIYCKKILFIFDEYPVPIRHKLKTDIPFWKKTAYKFILPSFSGYISISQKLANYFCNFAYRPTHIMSIIVNTEKFTPQTKNKFNELDFNLVYIGNMELTKDNVNLIIEAFAKITIKYPNAKLQLYGTPNESTRIFLSELINRLGLSERVFINKRVSSDKVPSILSTARILVSSQPNTKRAAGGFPTKLGEYLAMGIPTLISDVGENAAYIKPNEECFFAIPDSVDDYAQKLDYILSNYDKALEVAQRGQQLIINNYSHIAVGKKLHDFILKIQ